MECEENLLSKDYIFVLLMLAGLHVRFSETGRTIAETMKIHTILMIKRILLITNF